MINVIVFNSEQFELLLSKCYPNSTHEKRKVFAPILLDVCKAYGINTPLRLAHFLAQLGHESGELRYVEEIASGEAYEGRKSLGNVEHGDGKKYKGRGLIQLTGRANYLAYARNIQDLSLMEEPQRLAEDPELAADSAGWFWKKRTGHDLSAMADKDNLLLITRLINGGLNGLTHRRELLDRCKAEVMAASTRIVQYALNSASKGRWPVLNVDGAYGPNTTSVVSEFQRQYMVETKAQGEVDRRTWETLYALASEDPDADVLLPPDRISVLEARIARLEASLSAVSVTPTWSSLS